MPSPETSEILSQSGLDLQILDCEHGRYDYANLLQDMMACERGHCIPLVRVSGTDSVEAQRLLDLGAHGLVIPQLADRKDFERAAAMMDYPPAGTRGFNPFVRAGRYGLGLSESSSSHRAWFVPIVETLTAVEQLDEILQIERIDLIYIGAYDLSAQLGCADRMDDPRLVEIMDRIVFACHAANKPVAMMALSPQHARALTERGVEVLVHGVETHRIKQAITGILSTMSELRLPDHSGTLLDRLAVYRAFSSE